MFDSKLLNIINSTLKDQSERRYDFEEIAIDLHTEISFEDLDIEDILNFNL